MTVHEDEAVAVATSELDPSLPAGAPLVASLDLHSIDSWASGLSAVLSPREIDQIERVLELPSGSLTGGSLAAGFGLDPGRPAVMAMAPLDPAWQPRLRAIDDLARRLPPSGPLPEADDRAFEEILSSSPPLALWVRGVVPVHDATRALRAIQSFLALQGEPWRTDAPEGFDTMIVEEHDRVAVGISHDSGSLVFDVWSEVDPRSRRDGFRQRAAAALARIRGRVPGGPGTAPLPLEGDVLRVSAEPAGLASIGFAHGLANVHSALGWSDVDPRARVDLRAQGLREAHRILELAGTERGAYFERFLLSARGGPGAPEAELSAVLGPAMASSPGAWTRSTSIDMGPRGSGVDMSRGWLESFPLPGSASGGQTDAERLVRQVEEGGAWASIVAAPFFAVVWPQLAYPRHAPSLVTTPAVRALFERVGVVRPSPDDPTEYWFGLMPAGTTAAQAARAARSAGPATRVSRAGERYVVLAAATREALSRAPTFVLARAPMPPGRAQADLAAVVGANDAAELRPWVGPGPFRAELDLEGSAIRVRVRGAGTTP